MTTAILGISDSVTTCECCGRTNLKKTVAVSFDSNAPVYYGTECAARATGRKAKDVTVAAKVADDARAADARLESEKKAAAEDARWDAFLAAKAPGLSRFAAIQALGGFAAARAAYKAA
jgi:hypothetical protein